MIILPPSLPKTCIYCGAPTTKGKKGEHIIAEAIGGVPTVQQLSGNLVCTDCNNGVLGEIDRELCSRSYLSTVASQELSADLWQAWDVDENARRLLVEAKPKWDGHLLSALIPYPQITFERDGPVMRGDLEEMQQFGFDNFETVLNKAVRNAFDRHRAGVKRRALHLERVQSNIVESNYRLAPRVYTTHTISEIAKKIDKQSFIVRYVTDEDLRHAYRWMAKLGETPRHKGWKSALGSHLPAISLFFDIGWTVRALMKIGVNLLASYCEKTSVNHETFAQAIRLITGKAHMNPGLFKHFGFVKPANVEPIKKTGCHSFRLVYAPGQWMVYSSFFGGRIGSFVAFPGPNHEDWSCADIVAPIKSRDWIFTKPTILQPMNVEVQWGDSNERAPSLQLQNTVSAIRAELALQKRRKPPRH
jgi:hypothetical protein